MVLGSLKDPLSPSRALHWHSVPGLLTRGAHKHFRYRNPELIWRQACMAVVIVTKGSYDGETNLKETYCEWLSASSWVMIFHETRGVGHSVVRDKHISKCQQVRTYIICSELLFRDFWHS